MERGWGTGKGILSKNLSSFTTFFLKKKKKFVAQVTYKQLRDKTQRHTHSLFLQKSWECSIVIHVEKKISRQTSFSGALLFSSVLSLLQCNWGRGQYPFSEMTECTEISVPICKE